METVTLQNPRVLLVEPDEALAGLMATDLREVGYDPAIAADPKRALEMINQVLPSLVVIDRIGEASLALCSQLREAGYVVPVVILMAQDGLEDRIACLESGADDYFLKPYRLEEFLKLLKLYLQPESPGNAKLRFGDLVLDLATRQALRNNRSIELTMKEFDLLRYLMEHPREVLTREQILENVWGYDFGGESNVIEVYIRYLRLKIDEEGEKRLIQTVRGVGYVLREA
jgi:two-component system, OmpR family, response regulator NblR